MRVLINTCIVFIAFAITIAAQDKVAIPEVKISGGLVATIKNGDFVHPTFSPDAKLLAYSKVIVKGDFENTEVLLSDLSTHKQSVLLNSTRAERYATYQAFVTGMQWKSKRRFEVSIGDGDVGVTHLILDPVTRKLLQESSESFDEVETTPMSPDYQKAFQQARGLISLPDDSPRAFAGGISFKSSIIIVLSRSTKTLLFHYRDGKIRGLGEFNSKGLNRIEVKHVSPSRIIFLIRTHEASERGDNPLFVFHGSQLLRIKEYSELHDAEVDPSGRRIAYCYWVGDKRHIVVRELN